MFSILILVLIAASIVNAQSNLRSRVFTVGDNVYGQLAVPSSGGSRTSPIPLTDATFNGENIVKVFGGEFHSVFIGEYGTVFTCGADDVGQLGDGNGETPAPTRERPINISSFLPSNVKIVDGAAGDFHTLLISDSGRVFTFGQNDVGQCGSGIEGNIHWTPIEITSLLTGAGANTIKSVAAGSAHSIVLDIIGNVFTFGLDSDGQLGDGANETSSPQRDSPTKLILGVSVTSIFAGSKYSAVISVSGVAYVWGSNDYGQLCDSSVGDISYSPISLISKFPSQTQITSIVAGGYHALYITSSNRVYGCGSNDGGQLGMLTPNLTVYAPVQISMPTGLTFVKGDGGDYHSVMILTGGRVFVSGWNLYGQCALPLNVTATSSWQEITNEFSEAPMSSVSAGGSFSIFLAPRNVQPTTNAPSSASLLKNSFSLVFVMLTIWMLVV